MRFPTLHLPSSVTGGDRLRFPGPFFASRGFKLLFCRKAYSPHSAIRPSMVPSASQPVTSSSIFSESSEPFFVATP